MKTLQVNISSAERSGQIVAHYDSACFSGSDLKRLATNRKCYVVIFLGLDAGDEPAVIYATDDVTAMEFAQANWHGPFQLTERISTWRVVGSLQE